MSSIVSIQGLQFSYSNQANPLFQNLDFNIGTGQRFGLFGPNGAGKTTLMNLITGVLQPNSGEISVFEKSYSSNRKSILQQIGFVPQELSFYEVLSPNENLEYFGACYGLPRKEIQERSKQLLEILGLGNVSTQPVKEFSGGMKRRVNLAIGVLHKPKLLFLDEPTTGVDIQSRNAILDFLKELNTQGTTLVYTSHLLREAEELCDHIALIDEGKILTSGPIDSVVSNGNSLEEIFLQLTGKAYRD